MRILLAGAAALSLAYGFHAQDKETIRQTYPAAARVEIGNINGSIHVTASNGSQIQMVAEKTIIADSEDRLDAARREVKLDISQSGDLLRICVDGPFRRNCGDDMGIHDDGHHGYRVTYHFDLQVPAATILKLRTVNHGEIRIENTAGDFDLGNVNGRIELSGVSGAGSAHTVNGPITASFATNPSAACSFKSVNGSIEASFQPSLAADVRLKTFNGAAYTDYEVTALPTISPTAQQHNGRFVYRGRDANHVRIGAGGPEIRFETLNGDIRILKRGQ